MNGTTSCARCGTRLPTTFLGSICPRCTLQGAASWSEDEEESETPRPNESWSVGSRVGDYELLDVLGRGGMAVVYLARQVSLDRLVALKTVAAPLAEDAQGRERFRREARAIAQLEHPRIVSIHDIGTSAGAMFYTMDYIAGADLGRAMQSRTFSVREAAALVQKIAEAVAHANERGVLHRDLKPGNVLLDEAGEPHVTDFGIALEAEAGAGLTMTGDVLGTPPYMAPEALAGGHGKSSAASEVYSLGAILFHLLTGRTPFAGTSASEILHLAMTASPPSPRLLNPVVPRDLETICLKCLEKSRESRYADAGAIAEDLRRFLAGEEILARPVLAPVRFARWARRRPAPAALLVLLIVGAIAATLAAVALERARERAVKAETDAREQLFEAQLARAESLRGSRRPGQRSDALAALQAAAKIKVTPALRAAGIAALAQTDLRIASPGPQRPRGNLAFAFAPDLQTTVTEREHGVLEWWSGQEGPARARVDAKEAGRVISQPAFSPDGRFLLTRHKDKAVRLWLVSEGHLVATLVANAPAEPSLAFDCAWRPDSAEFALASVGGGLTFYSPDDGRETRRWENALVPEVVRFSRDGSAIAAAAGTKLVILDVQTLAPRAEVELGAAARIIDWQPNSERIAIGCGDGRIRVLNGASGAVEQEFIGHRNSILSFGYFPHGELAISYGKDSATRLWDTRTGETLVMLPGYGGTGQVEFSSDGSRAGLSGIDLLGVVMEVTRPSVVREFAAVRPRDTGSLIGALDFTRDGERVALATWGGVEVVEFRSGRVLASFPVPEEKREECSAMFAPDGSAIYISGAERGLRRHRGAEAAEVLLEQAGWLLADATPDGAKLGLVNRDEGAVKIVNPVGEQVQLFTKHPNAMFAAISPDGKWLATQGSGRGDSAKLGARVWSLADEALVKEFATGPLGFVAFSGDGRWFGGAGVKAFELVRTGDWNAPHQGLPEEAATANGAIVSFAADGELVASTANEKVYLLHPETGAELGLIASPSGNPSTARVRLSPDGGRLAVMWDDGSYDLWDLAALHEQLAALGMALR